MRSGFKAACAPMNRDFATLNLPIEDSRSRDELISQISTEPNPSSFFDGLTRKPFALRL